MTAQAHPVLLIVDDEADILRALSDYLRGALPGVLVESVESGQAALGILRDGGVDLILSDFKMPGMDGLSFLAQARAIDDDVPRVLMTAFPDMDLAIRALNENRIQHFLTKPIEPDMLREVVGALLAERTARQQREKALSRSLRMMQERAEESQKGPRPERPGAGAAKR